MGFLNRIFRSSTTNRVKALDESISNLRLGIFGRLLRKYRKTHGETQGSLLCAAILNEALVEEPTNDDARRYLARHRDLIKVESLKLSHDADLAEAFSYLYAAQALYLSIATHSPFSERAQILQRACALSLSIPNTYEICGTGDGNDCIVAIFRCAAGFVESLGHG